jgi:hypothetical protein
MRKLLLFLLLFAPLFCFAQVGEYYYSNNHPKAKGLNFQIQVPIGFEQKEGVRPNIVQKFDKWNSDRTIFTSFNLLVNKDESIDLSTEEWRKNLKDPLILKEIVSELPNPTNYKYYVLDNYPGLIVDAYDELERLDITITMHMTQILAYVDSYLFMLQIVSNSQKSLNEHKGLLRDMANSVVFPDQY